MSINLLCNVQSIRKKKEKTRRRSGLEREKVFFFIDDNGSSHLFLLLLVLLFVVFRLDVKVRFGRDLLSEAEGEFGEFTGHGHFLLVLGKRGVKDKYVPTTGHLLLLLFLVFVFVFFFFFFLSFLSVFFFFPAKGFSRLSLRRSFSETTVPARCV